MKIINTIKNEYFVFFAIASICVTPLLILSVFNQPSADDFCYAMSGQNSTYFENQVKLFTTINGRYTTSAILSTPIFLSCNFLLYKFMPVIVLIALILALKYLVSVLFGRNKIRDSFLLVAVCLSIYIIQMPSIAQGLYWMSAVVSYQLSCILLLVFSALMVKLLYQPTRMYLFFSILLAILIIGTNEISMLMIDFLVSVIFFHTIYKTKLINKSLLIMLIVVFCASIFVLMSKGNHVRGETLPNTQMFFYSCIKTLNIIKSYLIIWVPITFMFLLLYFNSLNERFDFKLSKIFDVSPILVLFVVVALLFIGFFAGYWALGSLLPPRAINLIYFVFIFSFTFLMFVCSFHYNRNGKLFINFSKFVSYTLFCCLMMLISQTVNVKTAYADLLSGKAYKYDLELKTRYKLIHNAVQDTVLVEGIKSRPRTLFVEDISHDDKYWLNGCYNIFFDKSKIKLGSK